MGKLVSAFTALALLGATLVAHTATRAVAQTSAPALGCNGQVSSLPMQGHYTGTWQTTGLYHFYVFGKDLELGLTINGTIDAQLEPGGILSGTARGDLQAPITHDGKQDISSGFGTISGSINGVVTPTGTSLVLAQPVIDMHWGTFDQGYTVERIIDMPNFAVTLGTQNCVGLSGTVSENGFPEQNVVDDGTPYVTHASGVGMSVGTWNLQSDGAATFAQLSSQVDSFIASANATLSSASPSAAVIQAQVVTPLTALMALITSHPDIQSCLLERLAAWEASVAPGLLQQAQTLALVGNVTGARQAGDLLRTTRGLDGECMVPDVGVVTAITSTLGTSLDLAISGRHWSDVALATRELLLLQPSSAATITKRLDADLHALLPTLSNPTDLHDVARVAYVLGDTTDATAAYQRILAGTYLTAHATKKPSHHGKKKKHHKRVAKPKPTATVTPSPAPKPKTLIEVLRQNITNLPAASSGSVSAPAFRWSTVAGAARYMVIVTGDSGGTVDWSWSGAATSIAYGDTTLDALPSSTPPWTLVPDAGGWHWSVLALDSQGHILAAAFRLPQ